MILLILIFIIIILIALFLICMDSFFKDFERYGYDRLDKISYDLGKNKKLNNFLINSEKYCFELMEKIYEEFRKK